MSGFLNKTKFATPSFIIFLLRVKGIAATIRHCHIAHMNITIGVMSDTHGHYDVMNEAARSMKELGANLIFHLGDDLADTAHIELSDVNVVGVPGIYEDAYHNSDIKRRRLEEIGGIRFLLSHTPNKNERDDDADIDPNSTIFEGRADILLYGHTHTYTIEPLYSGWRINPGHLNPLDKRHGSMTFAIMNVTAQAIVVTIIDINGRECLKVNIHHPRAPTKNI